MEWGKVECFLPFFSLDLNAMLLELEKIPDWLSY